jgi:membrane protein required for colicin V production
MLILDIIIATLLFIAFIAGVRKGIIRQIFGLAALLLGVYCAFRFSHVVSCYLAEWFHINNILFTKTTAFVVIFIGVLLLVILIGRFAARLITLAALGIVDKILGGLFSLLKIMCIFCVILFILQTFNTQFHFLSAQIEASFFYRLFDTLSRFVFPYLST